MGDDPRTEAFERLGGAYEVRVLEPSPPAVTEEPWFADDPAAYGGSPGDDDHPEPYFYVLPLGAAARGELWQASGFAGAELPYAQILAADDQRAAALDFCRTRLEALTG